MKKILKTFLATNLSLLIALSLVVTPIPENNTNHPITPLNDLTDSKGDIN